MSEGVVRLNIVQCLVNQAVLSDVEAAELAIDATPRAELALVPLLPDSDLAKTFADAGFLRRSIAQSDPVLRNTRWSAYYRPDSPLASSLADPRRWKVWYGWSHH